MTPLWIAEDILLSRWHNYDIGLTWEAVPVLLRYALLDLHHALRPPFTVAPQQYPRPQPSSYGVEEFSFKTSAHFQVMLSTRLRFLRKFLGLSREQLADALQLNLRQYSAYETPSYPYPLPLSRLVALCHLTHSVPDFFVIDEQAQRYRDQVNLPLPHSLLPYWFRLTPEQAVQLLRLLRCVLNHDDIDASQWPVPPQAEPLPHRTAPSFNGCFVRYNTQTAPRQGAEYLPDPSSKRLSSYTAFLYWHHHNDDIIEQSLAFAHPDTQALTYLYQRLHLLAQVLKDIPLRAAHALLEVLDCYRKFCKAVQPWV